MKCPTDGTTLTIADRSGIEIDFCPECRGVWLDRGELDKILERSEVRAADRRSETAYREPSRPRYDDDEYGDRYRGKRRKRESFLGELFDF